MAGLEQPPESGRTNWEAAEHAVSRLAEANRSLAAFSFHEPKPRVDKIEQTYHVPRQFGMSTVLAITTALALVFASLRLMGAPPIVHLFFGLLVVAICVVEMRFGHAPRRASMIVGAVLLPAFVSGGLFHYYRTFSAEDLGLSLIAMFPGALLGYLAGAYIGAVILLLELAGKLRLSPGGATSDHAPP